MSVRQRAERLLAAALAAVPGAEERAGQREMTLAVDTALRTGEHLLVQAGTGTGKALDVDTPVATPRGWARMGDLVAGDVVFDESGAPTPVVEAFEVQQGRPCYEVCFSDGTRLVADADHEWVTADRRARKREGRTVPDRARARYAGDAVLARLDAFARSSAGPVHAAALVAVAEGHDTPVRAALRELAPVGRHPRYPRREVPLYDRQQAVSAVLQRLRGFRHDQRCPDPVLQRVTTEEIARTLRTSQGALNHAVPVAGALDLPAADLPLPPYVLGVWLGDGDARKANVTTVDAQVVEEVRGEGLVVEPLSDARHFSLHRAGGRVSHRWADSVTGRLRTLGVLHDKHVPTAYLRASVAQRRALLQGLMDTDGTVGNGSLQYDGTNRRLVEGVHELVLSLGHRAQWTSGPARMRRPDGSTYETTCYSVSFTTAEPVFRLERKLLAQRRLTAAHSGARTRYRYVTAVTPVPSRPVRCIQVAAASHLYLAGRSMVPTHNSIGYLTAALGSGKRVVVATATKALQAQLVDKDLPRLVTALAPALGRTPTYALAKGRGNYVCLQQVHGGPGALEPEQEGLFETSPQDRGHGALASTVLRLREWAASTDTGDRDDVPFPVGDLAWRQVSVSARDCLGGRCPDRADCFSERARETAKEADVVVANHALLALDAFTSAQVLPEHDAVVLDEAHEFVASATDALTHELSDGELRRAVKAADGLLSASVLARVEDAQGGVEGLLGTTPVGLVDGLPPYALEVLAGVEGAFGAAAQEAGRSGEGEDELEKARRDRAKAALAAVAETAAELRVPSVPSALYAVAAGSSTALRVSPLSVGGALNVRLFGERTVVATSATLTLGGSFRHAARQMGLPWLGGRPVGTASGAGEEHDPRDRAAQDEVLDGDDERAPVRWRHLDVGSPFDHGRQAQLWVASQLPDPGRMPQSWAREVDELLAELVQAAGGRTLGLFSSTAAAARAAAHVRAATDLPVLLQGEDSAGALAHRFASDARTCLFGTRSFWQGVDVPGPACQLVVIDRIPFAHVDDPLVKARLADAGAHGFQDVTLPPAAVLLAQGAGRLLRAPDDRGVVAVLDPRLETARYAGLLVQTLPPFYRARSKERVLASLRAIDAAAPPVVPPGARSPRSRGVPVVPAMRTWSVDEDGLLKAAVQAGRSLTVLAERHEVSEAELADRLRWLGLPVPA